MTNLIAVHLCGNPGGTQQTKVSFLSIALILWSLYTAIFSQSILSIFGQFELAEAFCKRVFYKGTVPEHVVKSRQT